jgi:hypothetical protein
MAGEPVSDAKIPGPDTPPKKREGGPKLRRSAAWSLAVARMTDKTKLPDGEKG